MKRERVAVVNTNVSATIAQNALIKGEREMTTAMERCLACWLDDARLPSRRGRNAVRASTWAFVTRMTQSACFRPLMGAYAVTCAGRMRELAVQASVEPPLPMTAPI